MTDIKTTFEPDDIEWEMDWSRTNPDGSRVYPGMPDKEMIFEPEDALALMLLNEVISVNDHWWKKEWPEDAKKLTSLNVRCSDVFAWGSADAEDLYYKDIEPLYRMWKKDPNYGHEVWCIIKRREMPQDCVDKSIRAAGVWDLDALKAEHSLRANHYSGISMVLARRKYDAYCAWERSNNLEPMVFDLHWWDGWKRFTDANHGWCHAAWESAETEACEQWRRDNGFDV
jgi:hypothetical protein